MDLPEEMVRLAETDPIESITESLMPVFSDSSLKSKYLSFRATGFSMRESVKLTGISMRTLQRWREDDARFKKTDLDGMNDIRKRMGADVVFMEFLRNFRVCLAKDSLVLDKAYKNPRGMTDDEKQYLKLIRPLYTPQQLNLVRQALTTDDSRVQSFNFNDIVMKLSRTEVTISAKRNTQDEYENYPNHIIEQTGE
jgi:hypothetical protein